MKTPKFERESDLCAAFLAWQAKEHPDIKAYAEWAGWDILLVYPEGWQLGIQAKLRLNAEVIGQAAPDRWWDSTHTGPDFRGILVPEANGWSGIASRLGLVVLRPYSPSYSSPVAKEFTPSLQDRYLTWGEGDYWTDWNPPKRHELPPVDSTDAVAGSPCPVSLTPWKLGALDVLAHLETKGTITAKQIRACGVDPRRWTQCCWIMPTETRGLWTRGEKCPRFDQQHPTAYAAALAKAQEAAA